MQNLNRTTHPLTKRPEKILQFGTGNFLRAFINWQIQALNEHTDFNAGVICAERSLHPNVGSINRQDGLYHSIINGLNEQGDVTSKIQLIDCITREIDMSVDFSALLECAKLPDLEWIFSNTTEAGITYEAQDQFNDNPPSSFPAKLTRFLFERFSVFKGDPNKGFTIIPCELIDYNGATLKNLILKIANDWQLGDAFLTWLNTANAFYSSLVDRIVPGFPHEKASEIYQAIQCQDDFLVTAEYFYLFVIEVPLAKQAALKKKLKQDLTLAPNCPLNIIITDDITPYKQQKVAILNGAHTALVPVAYLAGIDTVGAAMQHPELDQFIKHTLFDEIIPTLSLPQAALQQFATDVIKRFNNPHIKHLLLSIALNSMTKFKTRNLPQLLQYQKQTGQLPKNLCFALAALIVFYRGVRDLSGIETPYVLQDDQPWLDFYQTAWTAHAQGTLTTTNLVTQVLSNQKHWEHDLSTLPDLIPCITRYIDQILDVGMLNALIALNA